MTRATRVAQAAPAYRCNECGHQLRVTGLGRHRVFFELDEQRSADPVMDRACSACGRGLPGKNAPFVA
jgi:hypothetical protein